MYETLAREESSDMTLASESFQLYNLLGSSYLELDGYRGDDFDVISEALAKCDAHSVLDLGCGPGAHIQVLLRNPSIQRIVGADFSPSMVRAARSCITQPSNIITELLIHDVCNVFPESSTFDAIICMNNVLGNVIEKDVKSAFGARKRLVRNTVSALRKNGVAVFSVYNRAQYRLDSNYHKGRGRFSLAPSSLESVGDLIIEYMRESGDRLRYYTHWFTIDELQGILEEDKHLRIFEILERESRIIAMAIRE